MTSNHNKQKYIYSIKSFQNTIQTIDCKLDYINEIMVITFSLVRSTEHKQIAFS